MKTTTYICDVCKKSVGEAELFEVSTSLAVPKQERGYSKTLTSCKKDVCRDCLEKKGIVTAGYGIKDEHELAETKNQKTLESKLIDILEDLGVSFGE